MVSGAYWAGFKPHGMTNVYRNVQNVVVKLAGQNEGKGNHSLMLNCHFDSVAGSPGMLSFPNTNFVFTLPYAFKKKILFLVLYLVNYCFFFFYYICDHVP